MIDKARIDRAHLLREEATYRNNRKALSQVLRHLQPGEQLGEPFRCALGILIPIEPSPGDGAPAGAPRAPGLPTHGVR